MPPDASLTIVISGAVSFPIAIPVSAGVDAVLLFQTMMIMAIAIPVKRYDEGSDCDD